MPNPPSEDLLMVLPPTGAAALGGTHAAFADSSTLPPQPDVTAAAVAAEDALTPADVNIDALEGSRSEDGPRVWLNVEVDGQAWGRIQACSTLHTHANTASTAVEALAVT